MSNKEIEKQAESLIDQLLPITRARMGEDREVVRIRAIKAAIVSCRFADDNNNGSSDTSVEDRVRIYQIKAYLEGLL